MKTALLTCLLLLIALMGRGQDFDFAPEGAIWNYYRKNQGIVEATPWFYAQGDTLISGRICRKMITPHAGVIKFYYYVDKSNRKVYRWDEILDDFILDIDFSVKAGEVFQRTVRLDTDCLINIVYLIERIDTTVIENKEHHFFHASYELPADICGYSNDLGLFGRTGCLNELPSSETYKTATYSTLYGYSGIMIPISVSAHIRYGLLSYQDANTYYLTNCQLYPIVGRDERSDSFSICIKQDKNISIESNDIINNISIINNQGKRIYNTSNINSKSIKINRELIENGVYVIIVNDNFKKIMGLD